MTSPISPIKRKRRTKAEVEAIREVAREELEAGHPMTLRQVHYRIVARGEETTYRNIQSDYNQLSKWLVQDRLDSIIPWSWIEDRLRRPRQVPMWNDLPSFLRTVRYSYQRNATCIVSSTSRSTPRTWRT